MKVPGGDGVETGSSCIMHRSLTRENETSGERRGEKLRPAGADARSGAQALKRSQVHGPGRARCCSWRTDTVRRKTPGVSKQVEPRASKLAEPRATGSETCVDVHKG